MNKTLTLLLLLLPATTVYSYDYGLDDGTKVIEFRDADPFGGPIGNKQGYLTVEDSEGEQHSYEVHTPDTYEGKTIIELRPSYLE